MKVTTIVTGDSVSVTPTVPSPTAYQIGIWKEDGSEFKHVVGTGTQIVSPLSPGVWYAAAIGVNGSGTVLDVAASRFTIV